MSDPFDFLGIVEKYVAVDPASNLYFLIDQGGMPGLYNQLVKSTVEWASLFGCTREENALAAAPILILVGVGGRLHISKKLLGWIGANARYSSSLIILSSALSSKSIERRLTSRFSVKLSEDMGAMLRFFDPRILENLVDVFNAEQAGNFFSVANIWSFFDRSGNLVKFAAKFNEKDDCNSQLELSQEQESLLLKASEVDQVSALLRQNLPEIFNKIPASSRYDYVKSKINFARMDGLDTVLDFSIYVTVLMLKGDNIVDAPFWRTFLDGLKKGDLDLCEIS